MRVSLQNGESVRYRMRPCEGVTSYSASVDEAKDIRTRSQPSTGSHIRYSRIHHAFWLTIGSITTSCFSFSGFLAPQPANAHTDSSLERRFIEDAPKAWDAYRRFWLVLQGSSSAERRELAGDTSPTRMRFLRKQCKDFDLLQIETWEPHRYSGNVSGENSQYSFQLTRDQDSKPWVIRALERKTGSEPGNHAAVVGLSLGPPQKDVPSLVQSPHFQLLALDSENEDTAKLIRVTFSYSGGGKDPLRNGWMLLDPNHDWVVRKTRVNLAAEGMDTEFTVQYDYKDGSDHHPIITKSLVRSTTKAIDRLVSGLEVAAEFDLHEQEVVPEKEFMLSAFGLPEPGSRGTTRWYLWLGGLGMLCLALGLIVARLRRGIRVT